MPRAEGTFQVQLDVQENRGSEDAAIGRMLISKEFQGDLEGTSKGQMLSVLTDVQGSAGYVAMERVEGILQGRRGSFVLQHSAQMHRGEPQLNINVVPDSATGELLGLTGSIEISIADSTHYYTFTYTL